MFCFLVGLGPFGLVYGRLVGVGGQLMGRCSVGGWVPNWFARIGQSLGNVWEALGKRDHQSHIGGRCMPDVGWKGVGWVGRWLVAW